MKIKPGDKIPYMGKEKYITLNKTDNEFWYVYLPESNITFKSRKIDDIILTIWRGMEFKEA